MNRVQHWVHDRSATTPIRPGSPTRPNNWSWNRVNGPWDSLAVLDWIDSCRHLWTRCAFANSKKSFNPGTWNGRSRRSARLGRCRSPPARFDYWWFHCDLGQLVRIRERSRQSMRASLLSPTTACIYTEGLIPHSTPHRPSRPDLETRLAYYGRYWDERPKARSGFSVPL
jgi:hypothetical protein